jgi:hypothetical protein
MSAALAPNALAAAGRAKRCILLWMAGGPSQLDTCDPKTGTNGGPFDAIRTRVPGIRISEHLPTVAKQMKDIAIIRSMNTREGNHERATYLLHTGYAPQVTVTHPSLGAVVAAQIGDSGSDLPNFVSLGGPSLGSGFLGPQYKPLVVGNSGSMPDNLGMAYGVDEKRQKYRLKLLGDMEKKFAAERGFELSAARKDIRERALRMMNSKLTQVFDINTDRSTIRSDYNLETRFGRGCLTARRLIEAGVPFVEVRLPGWDTHSENFDKVRDLSAALDPGMGTLIADLRDRGLLRDTLVVWMGEFGRTPRINGNAGRDHFPRAWSVALAGGGISGGQVIGRTSENGQEVVDRQVNTGDLFASIARCFGISPNAENVTPSGRPITVVDKDGNPIRELFS